ncbi:MAG: hypothetical protein ABFD96_23345 [Armatimonadia bacterium]
MKIGSVVSAGMVVAAALVVAALAFAQGGGFGGSPPAGRGGGRQGGPGDMGAMTYLEKSWTAVSFQLDCTLEQQEALKPVYAAELQTRNQALEKALGSRDFTAMQKALETCKTNLNTKLKEALTDDQWQKLTRLLQQGAPPPPE